MKRYAPMLFAFIFAGLQACSSDDGAVTDTTDEQNSASAGALLKARDISVPASLTASSRAHEFDYTMTGVTGTTVTARAQLFEPNTQAPLDGHPLVVWAHGTTGISNACAPSLSFENFGNATAINALLSSGYAVLAPDYEGFGTDRIHPYYQRASHANAILDAIPAVHKLTGINISDDWAIVGHSQGGHVALATARGEMLPAYPLQAVVALAPGTDIKPFSDRAFEAIDQKVAEGDMGNAIERLFYLNVYGAYVAHAVKEVDSSFNPKSIFGETVAELIDLAVNETQCQQYAASVEQTIVQHFSNGGTVDDFQGVKRDWYDNPVIASRLALEEMGDEAQAAPLLILQGDADRQVPVAATSAFVDRQRTLGTEITYNVIAGARHGDVARSEFGSAVVWLNEKFPPR